MKRLFVLFAGAVALVAAGAPNWTATVTKSAIGGHVLGNPKAPVKLVEYLSYTCPHCAHFAAEASAPLKTGYVASGKVSVEFRNAVRDQLDMTAALAARCGGPAKFFGNSDAILAAQPQWFAKVQAWAPANGERMSKLPVAQQLQTLVKVMGLDAILAKRGVTPAQLNACMVDKASQQQVLAMTNDAFNVRKISGTPGFVINNELAEKTYDWAALEPKLKAAMAGK